MTRTATIVVGAIVSTLSAACASAETGQAYIASTQVEMKVPVGVATLTDTPQDGDTVFAIATGK